MAFLKVLFDCSEVIRQSYSLCLGPHLTSHEMVLDLICRDSGEERRSQVIDPTDQISWVTKLFTNKCYSF